MRYLVNTKQPRPGYRMVHIVQTVNQPAPSFFYRDMTCDEFMGYALTCHHMDMDAAFYEWYVHTQGWEQAQWYSDRYLFGKEGA